MTGKIEIKDLNYYTRFEEMNLDELKENAEALNTCATAFDILTLHKSISVLEEKLNKLSEELAKSLEVTVGNGSEKKCKIGDLVLEIYENQKPYRIRKELFQLLKTYKTNLLLIILLLGFILGSIFGIKLNFDLIKLLFNF